MQRAETLLDRAFEAIQAGKLTEIAGIYAELEPFSGETAPRLTVAEASTLRQKALRNARSLEAALAGVRAAKRRVAEVLRARDGLTYTAKGAVAALPKPSVRLSRKF